MITAQLRCNVGFRRARSAKARCDGKPKLCRGALTCLTTGLGAVPFLFVKLPECKLQVYSEYAVARVRFEVHPGHIGIWGLSVANAVAAGMMLAASSGMLLEAGGLFIRASEGLHGDDEEEESEIAALHEALVERKQWRKAMLIFTVMLAAQLLLTMEPALFCHSAAEGIAVGVAFSRRLNTEFGVYISLLLAASGVSATLTALIAILTSALAAFLFVEVGS
ncbi:hypothetical protein AK812_SmicGene28858 [Symbiodinium microadriaticum]|uniref:Uncharacterized protein n=1 Tax=Symbiodinium microadriaticum TaxID=2951 RepID=A0A1Q9D3D0_SYMMI|nr:hypothetical protein AK812_SmicGene28858 [Symbiodinium microadriaticum]